MMKQGTLATLAFLLSLQGAARAAEVSQAQPAASAPTAAVLENAVAGTVVFDDDGGRAQIVPKRAVEKRAASYHGGPTVSKGNVQAIFLGSAWREAGNRALEARAVSGLAGKEHASALAQYGIEASDLPGLFHEDLLDPLENKTVSDLDVQERLDRLFTNGTVGPYEANAVYVIFLAPGLRSKLGESGSEKDYLAYHNHFHSAAGVVRYVVVPYDANFSRWQGSARESLVQALINPEGNAWY
jgi:hypothetical protein